MTSPLPDITPMPPYPAPAPPPPGVPKQGTNGLATTSLIFGIIPCLAGFLGIVFGIVALVQLRRRNQAGKGMAIAGIVLGSLWLVGGVTYGIITAVQDAHAEQTHTGSMKVFSLRTGDCLKEFPALTRIQRVTVISCGEVHTAEVIGVVKVAGSNYPGDAAIEDQAQTDCNTALTNYSPQAADDRSVGIAYIVPTRSSWSTEPHNIICFAEYPQRTSSIH